MWEGLGARGWCMIACLQSSHHQFLSFLPFRGGVCFSLPLKSGLALGTCLTKWVWLSGTSEARPHEVLQLLPMPLRIFALRSQLLCCEKPRTDGEDTCRHWLKSQWATSKQPAATVSHVSEWRNHVGESSHSKHLEKNWGPRPIAPVETFQPSASIQVIPSKIPDTVDQRDRHAVSAVPC